MCWVILVVSLYCIFSNETPKRPLFETPFYIISLTLFMYTNSPMLYKPNNHNVQQLMNLFRKMCALLFNNAFNERNIIRNQFLQHVWFIIKSLVTRQFEGEKINKSKRPFIKFLHKYKFCVFDAATFDILFEIKY